MSKINIAQLEAEIMNAEGQWFVVNCQTGHEDKVQQDLIMKVENEKLADEVFDVKISKRTVETPTGNLKEKNKFPGYIFINMIMSERAWFIIRNTPGVTGFIGSSGRGAKPFPLSTEEVLNMLIPAEDLVDKKEVTVEETMTTEESNKVKGIAVAKKELKTAPFEQGDVVLVINGLHSNEEGKVVEMDYSNGVATISLEFFGRFVNTEIPFEDLQPVKEY
ncbi:transcription termination/antitermination protein NusG [Mesoplasma photuris]|uniref:transcription termination/antitermination protein NusG n=1 Tax=Mesoplasma photuris TaxID=217731 RepID=UPI0004E0D7ED|nr:transcription termination/antitermination protein NusG [Mesoplasma photuris]